MIRKTEKNLLSLRKTHIEDYIMSRRMVTNFENVIYQINPLQLIIDSNLQLDIGLFLKNVSYFL